MSIGRTSEPRTITLARTSGSAAITTAGGVHALDRGDVGQPVSGTGIPAGATIATVTSATAGTLSAAATTTVTGSAQLGGTASPQSYGFVGWSPESQSESERYTLAAVNANTPTPHTPAQHSRG